MRNCVFEVRFTITVGEKMEDIVFVIFLELRLCRDDIRLNIFIKRCWTAIKRNHLQYK
jgi:hypothetical protein